MVIKPSSPLPSWRQAPWLLILLIFITPLLVAAFIHPYITQYELKSKLRQDFDHVKNLITNRMFTATSLDGQAVIAQLSWTCSATEIERLKTEALSPETVRLIQIELANGKKCSNLSVPYSYEMEKIKDLPHLSLQLTTSVDQSPFARNFIYIVTVGENRLVTITNSTVFNNVLTNLCADCYQFDMQYNGLPLVSRGKQVESYIHNNSKISQYIPSLDAIQTLRSGDAMYRLLSKQTWTVLLILAFSLSFLSVFYFWHWWLRQLSMDARLQHALAQNEFIPHYQIIIDTRSNKIVGQEVLARWQKSDGSLILPSQFIPYAEDSELIIHITNSILEQVNQALPMLIGWASVNIVAKHLEQGHLSQWFAKHANQHTNRLCFELTERKPIDHFELAIIEINKLSQLCGGIKLDDFGTGFGGFSYLQKLGVDSIKIDKMFIDTIGTDDVKVVVLDAIIAFGHESNMEMIAEGVETQAQADYLTAKGVYLHQGYLYAYPMPLAELLQFYSHYSYSEKDKHSLKLSGMHQ